MAHLSELTHCLARMYIPSFEQCKQIRATLARRYLCGAAPVRQETSVVPDRKTCDKEKETKKRGRKNISFRGDCKFRAKESTISEPKRLGPFPFLCAFFQHVEASTSLALCLYLDKLSLHRATTRHFWLSKTDLKTTLLTKVLEWEINLTKST